MMVDPRTAQCHHEIVGKLMSVREDILPQSHGD